MDASTSCGPAALLPASGAADGEVVSSAQALRNRARESDPGTAGAKCAATWGRSRSNTNHASRKLKGGNVVEAREESTGGAGPTFAPINAKTELSGGVVVEACAAEESRRRRGRHFCGGDPKSAALPRTERTLVGLVGANGKLISTRKVTVVL